MKKILVLLIVAAIAVSAAACSSSTASSSSQVSSSSVSESVSSEASSSEASAPEEGEADADAPSLAVPEENQKFGDIITAARTQEFNDAFPVVLSTEDPNAQLIFELTGVKAEDLTSFAISVSPMNTKAYGVAILKPMEGKSDAVLQAVNGWVETQKKSFEQYLQDQLEIAKAATVDQLEDGTVVLVMSEGGAEIQKSILDALK